jgi:hypothetical protein
MRCRRRSVSVLECAAVIGQDFEWDALGELSPDGGGRHGARLAALVRNELIRSHDAIADTFSFRHALIRDAAYGRLPKELRSDLHERFAHWLDARGEEFEEIVAYHLEQAYRWLAELGRRTSVPSNSPSRLRRASRRPDVVRTRAAMRHAAANLFERCRRPPSAGSSRAARCSAGPRTCPA